MRTFKIYLSVNTEKCTPEALDEMIRLDTQSLINMFRGYNIEIHTKKEITDTNISPEERKMRELSLLKRCDIYAMGTDWTFDRCGKIERETATSHGIPCVNTDTEYTPAFVRDYIISKCK